MEVGEYTTPRAYAAHFLSFFNVDCLRLPTFYATVNRGLEDVSAWEVQSLLGVKPKLGVGRIFFDSDLRGALKLNLASRTLHRVVMVLLKAKVSSLDDIYREALSIDYTSLIDSDQSFAVKAERKGAHPFTSLDIASKVGQAIIDSYRSVKGSRLKVDLKGPEVIVECVLRDEDFTLGLDLTGYSLHMRNYRVYDHPAALKSTIASSMILLSNWEHDAPLLDPMCGGGTIPIEAALIARRVPPGVYRRDFAYRRLRFIERELEVKVVEELLHEVNLDLYPIYGIDCSPKHLKGAVLNARSAGVDDTVKLRLGDALRLKEHLDFTPSHIIVNPPYGLRSGPSLKKIGEFYHRLLASFRQAARGSKLIAITSSHERLLRAIRDLGLVVLWTRWLMHGKLTTHIICCEL
ncbi:MAG: hypothetical protein DRJ97_00060 [Thermoprotei archaeon]|nr:MAG: hypothetical protein DRJ97_00060 [Thermoprotei archaeon]